MKTPQSCRGFRKPWITGLRLSSITFGEANSGAGLGTLVARGAGARVLGRSPDSVRSLLCKRL
jgi:hypothetical protein